MAHASSMVTAQLPAPRPHQQAALDVFRAHSKAQRFHFVMPPGSGKTLLGSLIAQEIGRRVLVLVPNTAIQSQWLALWRAAGVAASDHRDLLNEVTVLTYQAIATIDDDAAGSGTARLHPNALATISALQSQPFTLVLDEAHHLAALWGEILVEVLSNANAVTIALTATPPEALSAEERGQLDLLYGPVLYAVSTPALVRDGVLAPHRELPWFVTPTESEQEYLRRSAQRWQELLAAVMRPDFGKPGFFAYLDEAWVRHAGVSWSHIERQHPDVARAVLRLHFNQLCGLPDGGRVRDEHRQPLQVEDWVALLSDYGRTVLAEADQPGWNHLRSGLRSVGWTLTTRGARKGQSSLDRILARSAAKAVAAGFLISQESAIRGADLRAVVLTDFESAQATPPADVASVLASAAGSAWEALDAVQSANPDLRVVLMTGASVGGREAVLRDVAPPGIEVRRRDDGQAQLIGSWGPREWVPWVTSAFQDGRVDVLVGTRGLLGEGWDAPATNVLIDLTVATTSTAVVQVRGRAIRRDPKHEDKVAHIWSVVAVDDEHPRGDLDYRRLVAKHRGYLAPDADGDVVAGVEHLDVRCGPYAPPPAALRDAVNASALEMASGLDRTRAAWQIGSPYRDVVETAVRVRATRSLGTPEVRTRMGAGWPAMVTVGTSALAGAAAFAPQTPGPVTVGAVLAGAAGGAGLVAAGRRWRVARVRRDLGDRGMLLAFGEAVAKTLDAAAAVDVAPEVDGRWALTWMGASEQQSADFALAIEQLLAPVDFPRYVISRRMGRAVMWHAVPDVFGVNKTRAEQFLVLWRRHVSRGEVLYTGSAVGAGVAESVRGANPLDVSSGLYSRWG